MNTFPRLLKEIRKSGDLTQEDLAKALGVSTVLISMIESGQRPASKKLVESLSKLLDVHPGALFPFMFDDPRWSNKKLSNMEKILIDTGTNLLNSLIKSKSAHLKKYASPN